jgi:hypothetical protein
VAGETQGEKMNLKILDELDFKVHSVSHLELWSKGKFGALLYSLGDYRGLYRKISEPFESAIVIFEFNRTIPGTKYQDYEFWRVVY